MSDYNFNYASPKYLFTSFESYEVNTKNLIKKRLLIPAYDQCIKASHCFNLLDSRGLISSTEKTGIYPPNKNFSTSMLWSSR